MIRLGDALVFSTKLENFKAFIRLHLAYYDLVKNAFHCPLPTPAMAADVEMMFGLGLKFGTYCTVNVGLKIDPIDHGRLS